MPFLGHSAAQHEADAVPDGGEDQNEHVERDRRRAGAHRQRERVEDEHGADEDDEKPVRERVGQRARPVPVQDAVVALHEEVEQENRARP